jgi:hypothetical protein
MRAYISTLAPLMLGWEIAQLPLYTLWQAGTASQLAYAVLHCTLGDLLIGLAVITWSLILVGAPEWPRAAVWRVASVTVGLGIAYTVYSEWVNVELRQAWAYTEQMPRVPPFGTGLGPLLQWAIVPPVALRAAWVAGARAVLQAA